MKIEIDLDGVGGWWHIGWPTKAMTMADGSPRIQIDATEEMIETGSFQEFAKSQKDKRIFLMLMIPMENAKDLIEKLAAAQNDTKTDQLLE